MSSYTQILTLIFVLTASCGLELQISAQKIQIPNETTEIESIQQNHAQDNELSSVQEKNSFANKSDLASSNEIDNNKSERQVTTTRELTHKSAVVNTKLGDDRILGILIEALNVIKTPKCYKDLNYTIDAVRKQKPWAIASEFFFILIFFACVQNKRF